MNKEIEFDVFFSEFINESMLNCTNLIDSLKTKHPDSNYLPSIKKRQYNCNLNDITASEIKLVGENCFTNKKHINKRQKI